VDHWTGLVWQGCSTGEAGASCSGPTGVYSWEAALRYCQNSNWAGLTDWYLPNAIELSSIIDARRTTPAVDPVYFPTAPASRFWSSTTRAAGASRAWSVDTSSGGRLGVLDKTANTLVRCVRREP